MDRTPSHGSITLPPVLLGPGGSERRASLEAATSETGGEPSAAVGPETGGEPSAAAPSGLPRCHQPLDEGTPPGHMGGGVRGVGAGAPASMGGSPAQG